MTLTFRGFSLDTSPKVWTFRNPVPYYNNIKTKVFFIDLLVFIVGYRLIWIFLVFRES